jgi:hypothetical protein
LHFGDIYLRLKTSKISSPFDIYEHREPDAQKAITLMNHIFDNYCNNRYILYFVIRFNNPLFFFLALVPCRISWRLNLLFFPIHSNVLIEHNSDSKDLDYRIKITGKVIKEEFAKGSFCGATFLLFFIFCLRNDDKVHRPQSIGHRVIIEPQIAVHKYFI